MQFYQWIPKLHGNIVPPFSGYESDRLNREAATG